MADTAKQVLFALENTGDGRWTLTATLGEAILTISGPNEVSDEAANDLDYLVDNLDALLDRGANALEAEADRLGIAPAGS